MAEPTPISSPRDGVSSLARLQGNWRLQREVRHASGQVDRLSGTCSFTRSGPRLIQEERGTLETAQGRFQATRRYVWAETEGWLQVYFEDMRPFLRLPKAVPKPEATHMCAPDRYDAVFDFTLWPRWKTVWRVNGPRKAYVMTSVFEPEHP
ncbi:MAG: DUF6314 family protein [Pseudomonadota bacterium]